MQTIRDLFNWSPLRQLTSALPAPGFVPAFEVRETKDRYVFKADMPGVKDSDLDVSVSGARLTITGSRQMEKVEETDALYFEERAFGAFTRSFMLPEGADLEHIEAALKEGVLTLVVPKIAEVKARKIALDTGGKAKA